MERFQLSSGTMIFIALSVVLYALDALQGGGLTEWGAKSHAIWAGEWHRLVTANFLHSGLAHLVFNAYALFIFGRIVEDLAGRWVFFAVYLLGGATGFLASLLARPDVLSVGASAAVFALMGYTIHFRLRRVPLRWMPFDTAFVQILGLNLIMGFTMPNIDQFAHLGGFVGGFFAAGAIGMPERDRSSGETPAAERVFAAAVIAAFFFAGLAPLTFAGAVGRAAPQAQEAIAARYERYFQPYLLADPAVLWLDPSESGEWRFVEDRIRRPAGSPLAVAVFWRWVRGGGEDRPVSYRVTWERSLPGGGWERVQVDQGFARGADPGTGRIYRRSFLARDRAADLRGDWRLTVEVDEKVQFDAEFTVTTTSVI